MHVLALHGHSIGQTFASSRLTTTGMSESNVVANIFAQIFILNFHSYLKRSLAPFIDLQIAVLLIADLL